MPTRVVLLALLVCLSGCTGLGGPVFTPGQTTQAEVLTQLGPPAAAVAMPGGERRLFWTSAPMGTSTLMASFDAGQRLGRYEEVLDMSHFSRIQPGMSMDEVVREIGPPYPGWTEYFKARDELAWEWRYCDDWGEISRFNVLFDGTSKKVRSTLSLTEAQRFGGWIRSCGHVFIRLGPAAATLK